MSIQTELDRIVQAKEDMRTSLNSKGANVATENVLAEYPEIIRSLEMFAGNWHSTSFKLTTSSNTATFAWPYDKVPDLIYIDYTGSSGISDLDYLYARLVGPNPSMFYGVWQYNSDSYQYTLENNGGGANLSNYTVSGGKMTVIAPARFSNSSSYRVLGVYL